MTPDPLDAIADNAVVDKAKYVSDTAQASADMPPYAEQSWQSDGYWGHPGIGVGVLRVHVDPSGGVSIAASLEEGESGFNVGAHVTLDREEAVSFGEAVIETARREE